MVLRFLVVAGGWSLSQAACQLPAFGPFGYVPVPGGTVVCVSQGSLQPDQACGVMCGPNSTKMGGSGVYACGPDDELIIPTLDCKPSCILPPFGVGIIGAIADGVAPCSPGPLCRSCTCSVVCDSSRNFTAGSGSADFSCTVNGELRGGNLRCVPCVLPSFFNISHLNNSDGNCQPGAALLNNTRCDLTCDSSYVQSGNNQYVCDSSARLFGPNMSCTPQPCPLPPIVLPFVAGSCNTASLAPGNSCAVECDSRHTPVSGDSQYHCESLVPITPTLQCAPNNCSVVLPPGYDYAFDASRENACTPGSVIPSSSSCNIGCALGFEPISGSEALSCFAGELNSSLVCQAAGCAFFSVLPPGHVPVNCKLGESGGTNATLEHDETCTVACGPGYTGGPQDYSCSFGRLLAPEPFCVPEPCSLPTLDLGMIGYADGPHRSSCTELGGTLDSFASCDVMCDNTTYTTSVGTLSYTCYLGVLTSQPTAQCVPMGGCAFPPVSCLQTQTCEGGTSPGLCTGTPLLDNTTCDLACVATHAANASLVHSLSCVNGTMNLADNFCSPAECTLSLEDLGILGSSDVEGCVDGATLGHNQTCTLACKASLQLVVPAQAGSRVRCLYGSAVVEPQTINNQFCRQPACVLPSTLPEGYAFYPANTTGRCSSGDLLENYPSDMSCDLRCAQGYTGSPTYTCLQTTGLSLAGDCVIQDCEYVVGVLEGVVEGSSIECNAACDLTPGSHSLANGTCCDYQCADGYHQASATLRLQCPSTPTNCGNFSTCSTSPSINEIVCDPDPCMLAESFGPNVVGTGSTPCVAGMRLAGGGVNSSCEVTCAAGYDLSGTTTYSCALGVLADATLVCSPTACSLPSTLPYQQAAYEMGENSRACTGDLVLESGDACDVQCNEVIGIPGSTSYSCLNGNLSSASIVCWTPGACLLPDQFPSGAYGVGSSTCNSLVLEFGAHMLDGQNCSVECGSGYIASNVEASEYICVNGSLTLPGLVCTPEPCDVVIGPPFVASALADRCNSSESLESGQSCTLGCAEGYVPKTIKYMCATGTPSLNGTCEPASCRLPDTFPSPFIAAAINGCNQTAMLASGTSCVVECAAGYSTEVGSAEYRCYLGNLSVPDFTCSPLPCTKTLASHEVPDNSTGHGCGSVLQNGETCLTKCASGYAGETQYASSCNLGRISTPDGASGPTCVPLGCILPAYPSSVVVSSSVFGCFPGDTLPSGSSCSWSCSPAGFYDQLGSNVFTCNEGVLTSTAAQMSCIPYACTLLPFGPDVVGVAGGAVPACNSSLLLPHGGTCNIGCGSLVLLGSSQFACAAGVLSAPTGVCYNQTRQCVLNFSSPVLGEGLGPIFPCGRVLNGGSSCRVGCAEGYIPSGTQIYTCSASGVLTSSASLVCLGAPCAVPDLSAQGVVTVAPCVAATPVEPGCSYGYSVLPGSRAAATVQGRGGGELVLSCAQCAGICSSIDSCASYQCSPSLLQCNLFTSAVPSNPPLGDAVFCARVHSACAFGYHAVIGDVLGAGQIGVHGDDEAVLSCEACAHYCSSLPSCLSYECSSSTLLCNLNTVAFPNGPALPNTNLCVKDATPAPISNGFLASGSMCGVQCNSSYVAAPLPLSQTSHFSCKGGRLSFPSLRCVPRPCVYPSSFPNNYGPAHNRPERCTLGGTIEVGKSCDVECAPFFYRTSGHGIASCSLGPSLSAPTLMCAPYMCVLPANLTGYQVSGCPNNSSVAQCTISCAAGFHSIDLNGTAGTPTVVCPSRGGTFELSGCVPMPRCSVPTAPHYSVSCSGSSPYLASSCSASCAAGFLGSASLSCPPSGGPFLLSGCRSCACPEGSGRAGSCDTECVTCPPRTFNNGSTANCSTCPQGTCVDQNHTGCISCTIAAEEIEADEAGISSGGIAAAVIVPLLAVLLGIGAFIWWKKGKPHPRTWVKWKKPSAKEATNETSTTEMA